MTHSLRFSPADPFPLVQEGMHSYPDEQAHAAEVDRWLGLRTELIESDLLGSPQHQLWIGLPVKSLLTPYAEIRRLLVDLDPKSGTTLVDLGCGYGRIAFVLHRHFPEVRFVGYEYVAERVTEGQRCLSQFGADPVHLKLECQDLSDSKFSPISAATYFLYDFGSHAAIEKTLQDLRQIAAREPIQVIGRGRGSRDAIERNHPWLSQVVAPRHFSHYSIYGSR